MAQGFTLWFTGPPGSGKTTLACGVETILLERGLDVELLDGEMWRREFGEELGFDKAGRDILVRRAGVVCNMLSRNGVINIVSESSPYLAAREKNRELIGRYIEVYCHAPAEVCEQRDVQCLVKRARAGEIKDVPGFDLPYEPPLKAEIVIETDKEDLDEACHKIVRTLELLDYLPREGGSEYSSEEEEKIKKRLKDLGYI